MSKNEDAPPIARPSSIRTIESQNTAERSKSRLVQPRYSTRSSMLINTHNQPIETDQPRSPTKESQRAPETARPGAESSTDGTIPTRLRPRSMYQAGSTASQRAGHSAKSSQQSMRPPAAVSKLPEPQTSGLRRTQSLRKPGIPSRPTQHAGTTSHSRIQSVSATATRRDAPKSGVTLERSRSLAGASNANGRANGPLADATLAGGNAPSHRTGHGRSASIKSKSESLAHSLEINPPSRPEQPLATQSGRRDGVSEGPKKPSRPAFTTLQQHFTPRKTGKAPTATFLHPAPIPGPQSLPHDVVNLQAELLQLHLLHQPSAQVCRQWEQSAKRHLRAQFDQVARLHHTLLEHQRADQEETNLQSLLAWRAAAATESSPGLAHPIHILSEPLHELPCLIEPGGRLQRCVAEFQHWVSCAQQVRAARQQQQQQQQQHQQYQQNQDTAVHIMPASHSIEALSAPWKAEVAALTRKLSAYSRTLASLADPLPGSSLVGVVHACKALLAGLLDEVQTMLRIEAAVVAGERVWVERQLELIASAVGGSDDVGDGHVAAWRS